MNSPVVGVRVPEALEAAARRAAPELDGLSISELIRAGLAMLANATQGHGEAVRIARMNRAPHNPNGGRRKKAPGRTPTVPESSEVRSAEAREGQAA